MNVHRLDPSYAKPFLAAVFQSDKKFVNSYHALAGKPIEEIAEYDSVVFQQDNADMFAVYKEELKAVFGYVYEKEECPNLALFFVLPNSRHKEDIRKIWEYVWEYNKSDRFFVGIRTKNVPATKFYENMGGIYLFEDNCPRIQGERIKIFLFKKGLNGN